MKNKFKMSPNVWTAITGAHFTGKLADSKTELRRQVEILTQVYSRSNGVIHVCRPAVAKGSEFSRTRRPSLR